MTSVLSVSGGRMPEPGMSRSSITIPEEMETMVPELN